MKTFLNAFVVSLLILTNSEFAKSQSGSPVPSFGINGEAIYNFGTTGNFVVETATAIQTDYNGRIIVLVRRYLDDRTCTILRFNPDGTPDVTFNGNGRFDVNLICNDIILDSSGKILVASLEYSNLRVFRLNQDGSYDSSFGSNGFFSMTYGLNLALKSFNLDSDGNILVSGTNYSTTYELFVVKINKDGLLNKSFNSIGYISFDVKSYFNNLEKCVIESNKIIALGYKYKQGSDIYSDMKLVRFGLNGTIDSTFNSTGILTMSNLDQYYACDITIDENKKILIAGSFHTNTQNGSDFFIARLNSDGSNDLSFNSTGIVRIDFGKSYDWCASIKAKGEKIYAVGYAEYYNSSKKDIAICKINNNGTIDDSFGLNGKRSIDFRGFDDKAECFTIDVNGNLLIAGNTQSESYPNPLIVKTNSIGSEDLSFNGLGKMVYPISSNNDMASKIIIDPYGRPVIVGYVCDDFKVKYMLTRLTPKGELDANFNNSGKLYIDATEYDDYALDAILDKNEKIILCGRSNNRLSIVRIHPEGTRDMSFNAGNAILNNYYCSSNSVKVLVDSLNNYYLTYSNGDNNFRVLRLKSDGSIDIAFGNLQIDFGSYSDYFINSTIDKKNNIYLLGKDYIDYKTRIVVAKLNISGNLDSSFDLDGKVMLPPAYNFSVSSIRVDDQEKIYIGGAGYLSYDASSVCFIIRLNANGSIDSTFNGTGRAFVNFGYSRTSLSDIHIDNNGIITISANVNGKFAAARLNANGSMDSAFGVNGKVILTDGVNVGQALDENYIYQGGYHNGDFKIIKLYRWNSVDIDKQESPTSEVWVYPNPSSDFIKIISNDKIIRTVEVFDISGQLKYKSNNCDDNIYVGDFKNGMYLIKVDGKVGKFIKN